MKTKIKINTKNGAVISGTFFNNEKSECGIIILPGFATYQSALYNTAKKLSKEFKVWVFDLNSQGESTGDFDVYQMADSFSTISKTLKNQYQLKKLGIFGHSIGGCVALIIEKEHKLFDAICISGTPVDLKKISKKFSFLKTLPYSTTRNFMILTDKILVSFNKNYRRRTHQFFKTKKGYSKDIHIGALKIKSLKKLFENMNKVPNLNSLAPYINKPILLIYGGADKLNGFKKNYIPEDIQNTYRLIKSDDKSIKIISGADHNMNKRTTIDGDWNKDAEYQHVKEIIFKFFKDKL